MMAQTTLGTVANWNPPAEEEPFYHNILNILDELYPKEWRLWKVNFPSFGSLFGDKLSSEARLRFAIPTVKLARAHSDEEYSLSERRYRQIKRILLSWPLGRALISSPLTIMIKTHPSGYENGFHDLVLNLKPQLISRHEASRILKNEGGNCVETISTTSSRPASKRSHSPDLQPEVPQKEPRMTDFMAHQSLMMEKLCQLIQSTNENVNRMMDTCSSTNSQAGHLESMASEYPDTAEVGNWAAPPFAEALEAQKDLDEEPLEDFAPDTKESEAKITKADEALVAQGSSCQRFNTESWQNIRYAEVQKQFQASPAFTALKVNSNLATVTPSWQLVSVLEKTDSCLGAITHGLLQQRRTFQNIYQTADPQVKAYISKNFLTGDSAFRKTSDCLLQYVCGKRAEIIQQRRAIYKPSNKTLSELLHAIPPSENHLFAEPSLSELVKEQGGTSKFFPGRFHKAKATTSTQKLRLNTTRPQTEFTHGIRERFRPSSSHRNSTSRKPVKQRFPTKRGSTRQNHNKRN